MPTASFLKKQQGFTLIELLVTISILGVLAVGSINIYSGVLQKTRDAKRLQYLEVFDKSLKLYDLDNNQYPAVNFAQTRVHPVVLDACQLNWCDLEDELLPYISARLPRDPYENVDDTYDFGYDADSGDDHQTYGFYVVFEHDSNQERMLNDEGFYPWSGASNPIDRYEIGEQPRYCMTKAFGKKWFGTETTVCQGAN